MTIDKDAQRQFAVDVVRKLSEAGHRALWAGGCVRDLVLDHDPKDYDVATTATPEQVRALFGKRHTVPVGVSFGVVLVVGPRPAGQIEVATFRREGEYVDGRRPERVEFCTPEEDAHRRDFTINGMFYDPLTEQVLDYVGGEEDLQKHILRAIGDPEARFAEDKLRMLRAVRFTARFGFRLDEATAAAIRQHVQDILVVSIERITQELRSMLEHDHRRQAIELARELGLWPIVAPELPLPEGDPGTEQTLQLLQQLEDPPFELVLAVLCRQMTPAAARQLAQRLRLSNEQRDRLAWLVEHQRDLETPRTLPLSRFKRLLSHPLRDPLLELTRVRESVDHGTMDAFEFCDAYLRETPHEQIDPPPLLTGNDLIALGMTPGEAFKAILEAVRDAQLDEQIATRDEALALLPQLQPSRPDDKT